MNPPFNDDDDDEIDEIMQWPGAPGSFTSSEGFTGTDNDRVGAHPEIEAP